ncbi:MAG TPA: 6-phosphogluconolactonase [Bryobacteraceae bacterium]|nr:6-phosphogluconolactonase [Bryobacteraceae bacterium]
MNEGMKLEILNSVQAVAERAAAQIAAKAVEAVAERGRFVMAVSGGHTPWLMLEALAKLDVPWPRVEVFQVDERVAPDGNPDRNLTHLREAFLDRVPLHAGQMHSMPVEAADLATAAAEYGETLRRIAGTPPVLDLIHLGLGPDGHTASLVPGDPVVDVRDADVAVTRPYQSRQRLTLTYPAINRARCVLWVVTGSEKASMLARLINGDHAIPAGRVVSRHALIVTDIPTAKKV